MKIIQRFGGGWQPLVLLCWVKLVAFRAAGNHLFAVIIDARGAWIDVARYSVGFSFGRIRRRTSQ